MAYGLQCWDSNGNLVLDTSGRYCRLVYTAIVTGDGNVTLSYLDGKQSAQWAEATSYSSDSGTDATYVSPVVTRSGNTIYWNYRYSQNNTRSLILVFAYT